jgi:predicted GH43/DUF377 family glycosyl hydrolase
MERFQGNPILEPVGAHDWESQGVFNAAVSRVDKRVHILYRAMGDDDISRLGYAASTDGYNVDERLPLPVFEPEIDAESKGCEDPRFTLFGDKLVMVYTALGNRGCQMVYQVSLTSIDVRDLLAKRWIWSERKLAFPGIRNKDAVLFPKKFGGKYVMFHRLEPDVCTAWSHDLKLWHDLKFIMGPRPNYWDCMKVGAGGTPIELNEGWLLIYHGVDFDKIYSLGVVLLEKNKPEEVLYRSEKPILTPTKDYERFGKVPNVVFSCGNVLMDGKVLVYYGGADMVLCVVTYDLAELLPKN